MWKKRIAVAVSTTLIIAIVPTGAAHAGGQFRPFDGDLNGDGLPDRATLFDSMPVACGVRVELGLPGGGHLAPLSHHFQMVDPEYPPYCPDMGVITDLDGDGAGEIVATWHWGGPSEDLLVLRNFQPDGGLEHAFSQPGRIELADFDGDGRQDVYLWAQVGGIASYLNTGSGGLVPGPVKFVSCGDYSDFVLADFHGNGKLGLLVAYGDDCTYPDSGVAVVGHDGVRVDLERGSPPAAWTAAALDTDSDGVPDVRTDNDTTGEITHFISLGNGTFGESPKATFDRPTVSPTGPTVIDVLANDYATDQATVIITSQPEFGTATVNPDRTVTYTGLRPHDGGDRFTYRLNQDGKYHQTAVSIRFAS